VKTPNRSSDKQTPTPARLTQLGAKSILSPEQSADPRSILEAFPNPNPGRDYQVQFVFPEFTSVCPVTGQPDFATITVRYVPDRLCVEMKSLKLYFFSYRSKGIFYEAVTNTILDDLVAVLKPRRMTVVGDFAVRGGTAGTVTVDYDAARDNLDPGNSTDGRRRPR
jgi:7-cyano-7-deazaguanine reductase